MLLRGIGENTKAMPSSRTTVPTSRLVASSGGPARVDDFLQTTQHRHRSLHQGGEVPRRQGTGGEAAGKDRGRPACDHLKRRDHEQQPGDD